MEKVIIEALPLLGPPGVMAALVIYYFLRQQKSGPEVDGLDDLRSQMASVRHIVEENRVTIRQIRDMALILKDRAERGK